MSVDCRGIARGCCNSQGCSCFGYDGTTSGGGKCGRCGHAPAKHAKSSMTSAVAAPPSPPPLGVYSTSDDDIQSLDDASDDEATSEPFIRRLVNSMFVGPPAPPPPRRSSSPGERTPPPRPRPRPRQPQSLPASRAVWDAPPLPLPICRYPNCSETQFFDVNTGMDSAYCIQHMLAPLPAPQLEPMNDQSLPDPTMDSKTMSIMPAYNMMVDGMNFHTTPLPKPTQRRLLHPPRFVQTDFPMYPPRPSFFHQSVSVPNFQTPQQPLRAVQASPTPPVPLSAPVPLLPDDQRCIYPLCNKGRYKEPDGKVHQFCGRYHAREYTKLKGDSVAPEMKCRTQGCSRQRRAREDGNGYYDYCGRSCKDGNFRTTPAAAGEMCCLPGCGKPRYVDPANGRVHEYCGRTHANQALASGIAPQVCTIRLLGPSELSQTQSHFKSQWCSKKGTCPTITCAFVVTNSQLETRWNAYKQKLPGGVQGVEKHYHGTKLKCDIVKTGSPCNDKECGICGISKFGMFRESIRKNINFQRFGHGFYFAPNSSKCHDYTQGSQTHRAMLLVDILPGKKHVILNNDVQLTKPPDGCHSVYGKPGQALNYAELVVYNPDCVMPRYIIVYVLNGVHKIAQ